MNRRQKFDLERAAEFYRNQGEKVSLGYVAEKFEVPYQALYEKCKQTFWRRSFEDYDIGEVQQSE